MAAEVRTRCQSVTVRWQDSQPSFRCLSIRSFSLVATARFTKSIHFSTLKCSIIPPRILSASHALPSERDESYYPRCIRVRRGRKNIGDLRLDKSCGISEFANQD